jgi:hypothetical protein
MNQYVKEVVVAQLLYCPTIRLEGLSKTTKNLSQGRWCSGRDSKQAPL